MRAKPKHLERSYAEQFQDRSVVTAYHNRPPYPAEVYDVIVGLLPPETRTVLDVGCGTGDIARMLAPRVERIDAVDISAGMIDKGRQLPGGERSNLTWICASVEDAALHPPYGCITAGESLHWMDWQIVLPRFADALAPGGVLAIVGRNWDITAALWEQELPIIRRYTTNRDYQPYDLVAELEIRGLFREDCRRRTKPVPWYPTPDEYIECRHSQNGLSRDRMGQDAELFDDEVRALLRELQNRGAAEMHEGRLQLEVDATVTWGKPLSPS